MNQLLVLANMESYNAVLIEQGKPQSERLILFHVLAVRQMITLESISMEDCFCCLKGIRDEEQGANYL